MLNELEIFRYLGHRLPCIPHASGIVNRVLKPIYTRKSREAVTCDVLGRRMTLLPDECVDGNLLFCPQLYDPQEIDFLMAHLGPESVFVDVGAHIGFYSLQASKKITTGKILAIEANPETYARLVNNIELNGVDIDAINTGVSDRNERLILSRNENKNAGGQSFLRSRGEGIEIECLSLADVITSASIYTVDVMKFDIEGFEYKVMKHYFSSVDPILFPRHIIAEYIDKDQMASTGDYLGLLEDIGYQLVNITTTNRILSLLS